MDILVHFCDIYIRILSIWNGYCKLSCIVLDSAIADALSSLKLGDLILKSEQVKAINLLSQGHDVFVWFPTGYGKSICYQVLPFVFDRLLGRSESPSVDQSVVLVVSPLVSLMVDQVKSLRARGVGAAIISSNRGIDRSLVATDCGIGSGSYRILYSAPEALVGDHGSSWTKVLLSPPVCNTLVATLYCCRRGSLCLQMVRK